MRLYCGNTWASVEDGSEEDKRALADFLTIEQQGAEYSEAFRRHQWDGKIHLYNERHGRFPTGLTRMALGFMKDRGVVVDVVDGRRCPAVATGSADWLYDEQREAVDACVARTRGIVQAPTGSGKTEMFAALGKTIEIPWLVIVDTKDLLEQAAARYELRTGERAGRIGDGQWDVERFTVATFQTLLKARTGRDPRYGELVARTLGMSVDEAHGLPGAKFYLVVMDFVNAYYRFGFSATPFLRRDENELKMVAALGGVISRIDPKILAARGRWAVPSIWFADFDQWGTEKSWKFDRVYDQCVVHNEARNKLVVDLMFRAQGRPALTFVKSVEHGHILMKMVQGAGSSAVFAHGTTPVESRRAAIERLLRRDVRYLICSKIFNKGIDIPEASFAVNAAAGDSDVDSIQRLGRLTRGPNSVPGKVSCEYYDIRDRGQRWLSAHAKGRMEVYAAYGFPPEKVPDLPAPRIG